ncbi:hypothetical protein MTR67_012108 [Solanum verrucosum]|uniref:Uncharacterized protein n=1 Tax=Solanum verrucosum TaxID=315347 RepID=A0AAF0Q9R2_SOLVR|nr:hypothetical protein MTR67_012108 [Solanum verrucosum]
MCCLESKISGGDPSVLITVFRIKTFGFNSPGPPYPRSTPTLGQTSCQGSLIMLMGGACPRRGLAPPSVKSFVRVENSIVSKFNSQKLVGTPPRHGIVL